MDKEYKKWNQEQLTVNDEFVLVLNEIDYLSSIQIGFKLSWGEVFLNKNHDAITIWKLIDGKPYVQRAFANAYHLKYEGKNSLSASI
jgi:hypothetical protein